MMHASGRGRRVHNDFDVDEIIYVGAKELPHDEWWL